MEPSEVQALYEGTYAKQFNEIWHESEVWQAEAGHHITTLSELVVEGERWLDVGCGTGWMLSKFPGIERAGMDISPDMLTEARAANPDALFLREGDIRHDVPEWQDAWDLVSCNGAPWSYLASMAEIHQVADNLASWTAPTGKCLMGIFDITDYTGIDPPYPAPGEPMWIDTAIITGSFWSFYDAAGLHQNMVAPAMGYWIDLFSRNFRRVEIIRWPHDPPFLHTPRRNLLASQKREPGDTAPAEVIMHPVPELESEAIGPADPWDTSDARTRLETEEARLEAALRDGDLTTETPVAQATSKLTLGPLTRAPDQQGEGERPIENSGTVASPPAVADPSAAPELAGVREEVAALRAALGGVHATLAQALPPPPKGEVDLSSTSTRRLAREVSRRLSPAQPGFARRVRRRLTVRR